MIGKKVQVFAIQSILSDWFFPTYSNSDTPADKELFDHNVWWLESILVKVLISVCDMGNQVMDKEMEVDADNIMVPNLYDPLRLIIFIHDWIHIFKCLRNFLLDRLVHSIGLKVCLHFILFSENFCFKTNKTKRL